MSEQNGNNNNTTPQNGKTPPSLIVAFVGRHVGLEVMVQYLKTTQNQVIQSVGNFCTVDLTVIILFYKQN